MELQKLVQHDLDGLRVFHTFFHHQVALLVERRRPMWAYSGPTDPDCASLEELLKDEVWSRLDREPQLRDKDSLEGKPKPLHAAKLSDLVYSFPMTFFLSVLIFRLILSHLFYRGSWGINLGCIF